MGSVPSGAQGRVVRAMTAVERRRLEDLAAALGGPVRRSLRAASAVLGLWAGTLLIAFLVWLAVAWPVRLMGGGDIGLQSPLTPWVLGLVVPLCGAYAAVAALRRHATTGRLARALRADLAAGRVVAESLRITAARRFREPEHGGLLYCLRTSDDRVFVVYDGESQDLGVRGLDPLASSFRPRSELTLVRAPSSGVMVEESFAGAELPSGEPVELVVPPKQWPKPDDYCPIPWDELEPRLARAPDAR